MDSRVQLLRRHELSSQRKPSAASVLIFCGLAAGLLVAILISRDNSYWSFSDGVYLYSARSVLHGAGLYGEIAAAQPPPIYYLGAGILAVGDSLATARIALGLINLLTAATVMAAVWRLTGRDRLAAVAGGLALLTPRALHDAATLLPETFAAPLLMIAALGASRRSSAVAGGVAAALAASFKLAFGLPAAALAFGAVSARRYLGGLAATALLLGAAFLAAFGSPLIDGAVEAQRTLGFTPLARIPSLLAQAAWNLLPFTAPALAAVLLRRRAREPELLRALIALSLGSLAVFVTIAKYGTFINLAVVVEPALLALSAAGAAWAWDARAELAGRNRALLPIGAVVICLGLAQSATLLLSPGHPFLFARPFAPSDGGWALSPGAVDREVARIHRCPVQRAYSGDPYLAFAAARRMPGGQGDTFIINAASGEAKFLRRARADVPTCPAQPVGTRNSALLDRR